MALAHMPKPKNPNSVVCNCYPPSSQAECAQLANADRDGKEKEESTQEGSEHVGTAIGRVAVVFSRQSRDVLSNLQRTAEVLKMSRRHLARLAHALAEGHCLYQVEVLTQLTSYLKLMQATGDIMIVRCIHKIKFDETPMRIRGSYEGQEDRAVYDHRAKVFALQEEWVFVIQLKGSSSGYLLHGALTPAIRLCQSSSGEDIAKLLESVLQVPRLVRNLCPVWRLVESNENGSNTRAEKILSETSELQNSPKLHLYCAAHKTHAVAQRAWEFFPNLRPGLIKTLMYLKTPGSYERFLDTLLGKLDSRGFVVIQSASVSPKAQAFRGAVLSCFQPRLVDSQKSACDIQRDGLFSVERRLASACLRDTSLWPRMLRFSFGDNSQA